MAEWGGFVNRFDEELQQWGYFDVLCFNTLACHPGGIR